MACRVAESMVWMAVDDAIPLSLDESGSAGFPLRCRSERRERKHELPRLGPSLERPM